MVFRSFLENRVSELKSALPDHITPDKFIRTILTAATINPEILACERQSLWIATMRAANDGLLPDGQEGAFVAYKGKAQWIPMYQGLLKRFRNSGQYEWISAGIVYEGEEFDHWIDEHGEHFRHRPGDERDLAKVRRVYAIARTKDGGKFIADLSLREVDKHRAQSRASREDAPWNTWREEMMKKTALRVLSKLLPKSSDIDQFIRDDEQELYGVETPRPQLDVPLPILRPPLTLLVPMCPKDHESSPWIRSQRAGEWRNKRPMTRCPPHNRKPATIPPNLWNYRSPASKVGPIAACIKSAMTCPTTINMMPNLKLHG